MGRGLGVGRLGEASRGLEVGIGRMGLLSELSSSEGASGLAERPLVSSGWVPSGRG